MVVIQFIRPSRNLNSGPFPQDIGHVYMVPASVRTILETACYDCHSNNTRYPWYANLQPVGWMLASHVKNGKSELNFSEFGSYSAKRQLNKLKRMRSEIVKGDMPLSSYTLIHTDARLDAVQKDSILHWIDSVVPQ
ncbi:heme-binding domain-containing protein [Chitinophaga vietnamensis]|uniref:heme-binding domain-containing protein n=1 Tax=Chitinophaga vietnamensis TaxID=2593957 RepID=UPI001F2E9C16|nr:heme-binding domain-containing protein [Chitinophaga vietnamensis]